MSNLKKCIKRLNTFKKDPDILEILLNLEKLNTQQTFKSQDVLSLRARLLGILLNIDGAPDALPDLGDAVYDTLLALAKIESINIKDPITMALIEKPNRLFVSSGHKFNIDSLITFHHTRELRAEDVDKNNDTYKWLINPLTNQKFSRRDFLQIQKKALKQNITIYCRDINNRPIAHTRLDIFNINANNPVVNVPAQFYLDSIIENMENINDGLLRHFSNITSNLTNNLKIINLRIIIFFQGFICLVFFMLCLSIFNNSMIDKTDNYTKFTALGLSSGGIMTGTALIFHSLFSPRQDLQFAKKAINYIGRSIQGDNWRDINPNLS